ncbi:hypothetical protein HanPI659440_Chr11g0428861 [Helianthus annuus]|nr:hypothetical protein HanPI659440_Chr11g0428861 [Helianthus annuus]
MVIQENIGSDSEKRAQQIVKVDEIKNYLDCRYLSLCEAMWRMLAFPIHYSFPSVMKLTFHPPNQQLLTLRDSDSLPALLNRDGIRETMFAQWFALNNRDAVARKLTYAEIPTQYVWQGDNKVWKKRFERTAVGRIVYCNPAAGPKYYLRMLLGIVRGPRSFEEIKTVDGVMYETYKEACYAYGLLNDDKEWSDALSEAKLWASGSQLRELFVTMLLFCEVNRPAQLWAQNWGILSDDILYMKRRHFMFPGLHLSDDQLKNYCLIELNELLEKNGKSLADFTDMPQPDTSLLDKMHNRLIREDMSYNRKQLTDEHEQLYASLNTEQTTIYDSVNDSVTAKKRRVLFRIWSGWDQEDFPVQDHLVTLKIYGPDCPCGCVFRYRIPSVTRWPDSS